MLGEDEFKSLWESSGSSGGGDGMDLERFLKFNSELDDLFVFDDDEEGEDEEVVNDEVEEISSDMATDEEEETEQVAQRLGYED
mmetsp:Transcript_17420/g.27323  ORF Transcript_17420/g.27323 Transcript_17420/m.27323 type:complete len:84 (-) Transcript_17420:258-509(-)